MSAPLDRERLVRLSEPQSLEAFHRCLGFPTDAQLRWLLDQGIDGDAMAVPWPIRGASVQFLDGGTFSIGEGDPAIIFRSEERGETIDLVAWSPAAHKVASWRGVAFCLGDQEQVFNPATYFAGDCLHVHRTPLDWLKASRGGIVIVHPRLTYPLLRSVPRLSFDDRAHARQVRAWLQPPKPRVQFFIKKISEDGI